MRPVSAIVPHLRQVLSTAFSGLPSIQQISYASTKCCNQAITLIGRFPEDYALGFLIDGNGSNRYFWHPGASTGFLVAFLAYEKGGDGVVLMANSQHSKALLLEVVNALAKQYGWTEYATDNSRFSNPWVIGLIFAAIVLITYLLLRVIRHRKRLLSTQQL
jgi:hypothetical protein